MSFNRQGTGFTILRIFIGVFFLALGLSKLRWFVDTQILVGQLTGWLQTSGVGSISRRYLETIALPHVGVFARLVPLGELTCGVALIAGIWTPIFAAIAFLMALNFHIASGALFNLSFLTNGYGLPVLGSTLALVLGGVRLPWSVRG